jgi:5-methylcytosine-specific restriction endonuclease McrA
MRGADRQLELLERLQALLRESKYTTTYKFALLHALCDLALELPAGQLSVPLEKVAHRVIDLYWQQVVPFQVPRGASLVSLKQSTGGPAAAVALVAQWRKQARSATRANAWRARDYAPTMLSILRKDVLRRLQAGGAPIIYREPVGKTHLELLPGVPETLRRFHGLLTDMIQVRWTAWIERRNPAVAGSDALRGHLFGVDRVSLRAVVAPMLKLQDGLCFYSKTRITARTAEVDHVLPWSLTHNNSVGNLVLATKAANLAKRDRLPKEVDIKRWLQRNDTFANELQAISATTALPWDPIALRNLSDWAMINGANKAALHSERR